MKDTLPAHIKSPFKDYSEKMSLSLFTGYFGGNRGQAGVGPQGTLLVGTQFLMHLGGPASAIARFTYVPTSRYVVDPYQPKVTQVSGPISEPLYMLDVGVTADLTGEKLWHGTAPYAGFAFGLANGGNTADVGGYKFGTQFYIGLGGGVKWQIAKRWVMTGNAWFYFWQLHYPTTYFTDRPEQRPAAERAGQGLDDERRVHDRLQLPHQAVSGGMARASLTRRVTFAAAHRYRRADWSDEKNAEVFGACANPNFHGHSYACWVTVRGGDRSRHRAWWWTSACSTGCCSPRCASASTTRTSISMSPSSARGS